jgi:hypothetical protein
MGELEGLLTGALPSMECLKLSVSKGLVRRGKEYGSLSKQTPTL